MYYIFVHLNASTSFQKLQLPSSLTDHKFDPEYRFFNYENCNNNSGQLYYNCNSCKIIEEGYRSHRMIGKTLILIANVSTFFSHTSFTCFHYHSFITMTDIR